MIKKLSALTLSLALLILSMWCLSSCTDDSSRHSFTVQSYSTDTELIRSRLPALGQPERTYWKLHIFGSRFSSCIGPTSYRLTGFAFTDAVEGLSRKKSSDAGAIDYPEGIDPGITGFTEFNWKKYPDFTAEILGNQYIGVVLVDVNKRLVYFDLENL